MRESHDAMTDEERAQRKQRNRELYRMRSQRQQSSTSVADVAPPLSSGHIDYVVDVMRDHVNHEVSRMFGDLSTFSFSVYSGSLALSSGDIGSSQPLPEVILDEDYIDVNPPDLNDDDHFPDEQPVAAMPPPVNRRRGRRRSPLQRFSHNCARNYVDSPEYEGYVLPSPTTCRHCSAKLFPYESSNLCCKNGKIVLPYQPPPDELLHLYTATTPEAQHFQKHLRSYNHVFSFMSMGVHLDDSLASGSRAVYTYQAQGTIYHKIE